MYRTVWGVGTGCAASLVALIAANAAPVRADETTRSYTARYELQTPGGIVRANETLSVRRRNATFFVTVSSADGALISLPTEFGTDGEILSNATDPSVTCYNMAMAALYHNDHAPTEPEAVYVNLAGNTVTVPVSFKEARAAGGNRMFVGSGAQALTLANDSQEVAAGMIVDARIHLLDGELRDVVFNEATLVGSPAKPLSRMTCSLARSETQQVPETVPEPTLPG